MDITGVNWRHFPFVCYLEVMPVKIVNLVVLYVVKSGQRL